MLFFQFKLQVLALIDQPRIEHLIAGGEFANVPACHNMQDKVPS